MTWLPVPGFVRDEGLVIGQCATQSNDDRDNKYFDIAVLLRSSCTKGVLVK